MSPLFGEILFGEWFYGSLTEGYAIFLKAMAAPTPGVDMPVRLAAPDERAASIDTLPLALEPSTAYVGIVCAWNAVGFSEPAAFLLRTDEAGVPSLLPMPVRKLRLTPLSGRRVKVEWEYWEDFGPATVADEFVVMVEPFCDDPVTAMVEVAAVAHQRVYAVIVEDIAEEDCESRVTVEARRGGEAFDPSAFDYVQLDGTPPAEMDVEMTAI